MSKTHVLDASAVMAYLEKEPGHEKVLDLLERAGEGKATLLMASVNWGEVLYSVENAYGASRREDVERVLDTHPIEVVDVTKPLARAAARFKVTRKLPYADCFTAALSEERRATLVASDKDFDRIQKEIKILWLI